MIPPRRHQTREGIALILVLLLVVLTTIMVVAFLASIKTETSATRSALGVQNSRQLANLAVQTVISQIQQATQTSSSRLPGTVSWASQPGMIRCYDNTGAEIEWYKLYSAQTMTVANPTPTLALIQSDLPETSGTAGNWATPGSANYGVYTDINSPVTAADGTTLEYPIMNPAAATSIALAAGTPNNAVLGFDIQNPPGYATGISSATNNQAAMPVRWLYVLQNGTMVPGVASGTPGVVNVAGACSTNSIVGRVAFWTDDETCKLNINTAADGTYFDSPRFENGSFKQAAAIQAPAATGTTQDADRVIERQLAVTPPVANEYIRYVGNPAQTRLSYVLPTIAALSGTDRSHVFSQITPFAQWGGSTGGTVTTFDYPTNGGTLSPSLLTPNRQTPYATLDEWMFGSLALAGISRPLNADLTGTPILTNTRLQQLRFFLSANSDAPEVNLFGQPRISMWPIYTPTLTSNALPTLPSPFVSTFDQLIATASTLYGVPAASRAAGGTATTPYTYYFGRQNSGSPYVDFDNASATTSPRPVLSTTTAGTNTRNQNLFVFLRNLTSHAIPGYGASFIQKYTTSAFKNAPMDQILTEILDYIRSTNPSDSNVTTPYQLTRADPYSGATTGMGQVTPLIISGNSFGNQYSTHGFGRFYTVSEITMDFTQSQITQTKPSTTSTTYTTDPNNITITPVIYLGLYSPSLGPVDITPDMRVEIVASGLQAMTLNSQPMFPSTPKFGTATRSTFSVIPETAAGSPANFQWHDNTPSSINGGTASIFLWGGAVGSRLLYAMKASTYANSPPQVAPGGSNLASSLGANNGNNYMFSGIPINVPITGPYAFSGGTLVIKVSHNNTSQTSTTAGEGFPAAATDVVQTITVTIPAISFTKVPTYPGGDLNTAIGDANYKVSDAVNTTDIGISLVGGYDGDLRMLAGQSSMIVTDPTNANSAFVEHPSYSATSYLVHSLRDSFLDGNFVTAGFRSTGQLVNPTSVPTYPSPVVGAITSYPTTGDWDNGIGIFPDGPYINKADETGAQYTDYTVPYYTGGDSGSVIIQNTSGPNRTVASPVMFGSLPVGVPLSNPSNGASVTPAIPWQTLLFRPQAGHPGETSPEDELLLDWFWMPVVEPYAISTPFATSGKVNMNYQIAPFTYITRATALMGVLGSEYVISAANNMGTTYKAVGTNNGGGGAGNVYRYPVKVLEADNYTLGSTTGTFVPFQKRFASGEIFRSAAEICDIYLVPQGQSWTNWTAPGSPASGTDAENYWSNHLLTGDNTRERPYNGLYPRLTTKSNTYTVHVRAQALKSPSNLPAGEWIENTQLIASEYRGSTTINRYIDPQDTNIPDFLSTGTNFPVTSSVGAFKYSLDNYYKYRVLETRQFLP